MSGALLAFLNLSDIASAAPVPDGTILFSSQVAGGQSYLIGPGINFVWIEGWGAGGVGGATPIGGRPGEPSGLGVKNGGGGGGGGYFKTHVAVAEGDILFFVIGTGGFYVSAPVAGTATTLSADAGLSLAAATANPGGNGSRPGGVPTGGAAGTASGGSLANTSGTAGSVSSPTSGGGAANGGGDQTDAFSPATTPGGGGPGGTVDGDNPVDGANGQVIITCKTS
jgi:hypothetical protein